MIMGALKISVMVFLGLILVLILLAWGHATSIFLRAGKICQDNKNQTSLSHLSHLPRLPPTAQDLIHRHYQKISPDLDIHNRQDVGLIEWTINQIYYRITNLDIFYRAYGDTYKIRFFIDPLRLILKIPLMILYIPHWIFLYRQVHREITKRPKP